MGEAQSSEEAQHFRVVAYDFGIKQNILRLLVDLQLRCDGGARRKLPRKMCWR